MRLAQAIMIAQHGMTFDIVQQAKLFPSREILNTFFQCGIDDVASEQTMQWEPFELSPTEFEAFFDHCQECYGRLKVDHQGFENFAEWFETVAVQKQSRNDPKK